MLKRKAVSKPNWWKKFERDIKVFNYLFPWLITLILIATLLAASYLYWLAHNSLVGELSELRAFYAIINMTFIQLTYADMPNNRWLDIAPILVPLIGLPLFTFFGVRIFQVIRIFFFRRERGQEWQEALVSSTLNHHIVICGLGRIGYRVAKSLMLDYEQPLVGINDEQSALVDTLLERDVPVILGDTKNEEVLKKAGVDRANVVVICTNHDWVNLETLVRVRRLNPGARIVLRLFDDELAEDIKTKINIDAIISRSATAAISFAYAAIGGKVVESFDLDGQSYVLTQVPLNAASSMVGQSVEQAAHEQDLTIVCHNRGATITVEPPPDTLLEAGDNLFVFTTVEQMIELVNRENNLTSNGTSQGPILVCGLGHTGFRVATNLLELGCRVSALDFEPTRLSPRLEEMDIPLYFGDLRWKSLLEQANVKNASAIVACTEDDLINLQISLMARRINPNIRVVMRIFDDELSVQLQQSLGLNTCYSTSALAGPDFVSATLNQMNVRAVDIEEVPQVIVRLQVRLSALYDVDVEDLSDEENVTVLMHTRDGEVNIPPLPRTRLRVDDEIVVLTTEDKLSDLNRRNKTSHQVKQEGYG